MVLWLAKLKTLFGMERPEMYNIVAGRYDPMFMTNADVTQIPLRKFCACQSFHFSEQLVDIVHALRKSAELQYQSYGRTPAVRRFDFLGTASKYTQSEVKGQPVNKLLNQPKDAAAVLRNTFIGKTIWTRLSGERN